MQRNTRLAASIVTVTSAVIAAVAGTTHAAEPAIRLIGGTGTNAAPELASALPTGTALTAVEHVSASPGGQAVVVARGSAPSGELGTGQVVLVRGVDGQWTLRGVSGRTTVDALTSGIMQTQIGAPIVNDAGDVLCMVQVSATGATGTSANVPTLLQLNAEGGSSLLLRFGPASGPGVPALPPHMSSLIFSGPANDQWRFSMGGALFAGSMTGLLGPCTVGGTDMGFRTVVRPRTSTNLPPAAPFGTSIPVSSGRGAMAITGGGFAAQTLTSDGYTREGLAGVMMWDEWGLPQFAVRDGTTPIDGLADEFVLQTVTSTDHAIAPFFPSATGLGARIAFNQECHVAFVAKFGPQQPSSSGVTTQPAPVNAATGLFVKAPGEAARLVVRMPFGTTPGSDAPGLPTGTRFTGLGTPLMNAVGDVVFMANTTGPLGSRVSLWRAGRDETLELIALVGAPAGTMGGLPAATNATLTSFVNEPTVNRRGQVVFAARASGLPAPSTGDVLVGYDPTAGLSILAQTGQGVDLGPAGLGTLALSLTSVDLGGRPLMGSGNADGAATMLTDAGEVLFRATTQDSAARISQVVASVVIPTATGACCTGSTCAVSARLDCGGSATSFAGANTVCSSGPGAACCPADFDQSGQTSLQDLFDYLVAWTVRDRLANTDNVGEVGLEDLMAYLSAYLGGC